MQNTVLASSSSSWNVCPLTGPVTALKLSKDGTLIFVGSGSHVFVYDATTSSSISSTTMQPPIQALPQNNIHGMAFGDPNSSHNVGIIYGQKQLCVYQSVPLGKSCYASVTKSLWTQEQDVLKDFNDWILAAQVLNNTSKTLTEIAIGFAHNHVEIWRGEQSLTLQRTIACENHRAILYSMSFSGYDTNSLVVASGTVFHRILVWQPFNEDSCAVLNNHDGVIFGLKFYKSFLASVSDDRSVQLWKKSSKGGCYYDSISRMYGHTARVWAVEIMTEKEDVYLVSASEDATVRVWNGLTSECISVLRGHATKNVWSISVSNDHSVIYSGGADGSVKLWDVGLHRKQQIQRKNLQITKKQLRCLVLCEDTSSDTIGYCICNEGFVWEILLEEKTQRLLNLEGFSQKFCTIVRSDETLVLTDAIGNIVLYNLKTSAVDATWNNNNNILGNTKRRVLYATVIDEKSLFTSSIGANEESTNVALVNEWCLTSHKLLGTYYTTGSSNKTIVHVTCLTRNQNVLYTGDARGNIVAYCCKNQEALFKTKRAVHKRQTVTCIKVHNNIILTSGLDGTITIYDLQLNVLDVKNFDNKFSSIHRFYFNQQQQLMVFGTCSDNSVCLYNASTKMVLISETHVRSTSRNTLALSRKNNAFVIMSSDLELFQYKSSNNNASLASSISIHNSFHDKLCTSIKWISEKFLVSTSEDNSVAILNHYNGGGVLLRMTESYVRHTATVRDAVVLNNSSNVVTVGGENTIVLWELLVHKSSLVYCDTYVQSSLRITQAHRVNSVIALPNSLCVITGDSDGNISVLEIQNKKTLRLVTQVNFMNRPILCMGSTSTNSSSIVAVGYTSGVVGVYHDLLKSCSADGSFYYTAHDMGVNCMSVFETSLNSVTIVTGGDDQCLTVATVSNSEVVSSLYSIQSASGSALKALYASASVVYAAGYDQRLCKYVMRDDGKYSYESSVMVNVADITSIDVRANETEVVVAGNGVQVVKCF